MRALLLRWSGLVALGVAFALFAFGQNSPNRYNPPPVLARLERLQRHEDVCALVNRSGEYRLERRYAVKLEVFVGSLSPSQLQEFEQILDAAELRKISRTEVPRPLFVDAVDHFVIDVYRVDGEQHLDFNGPEARRRFRAGTDPVLKWLDRIQKAPHTQLAEASASHCKPGAITQARSQASEGSARASVPYLMTFATANVRGGKADTNCVIVYPDGRYRREKSTQTYGSKVGLKAFDGSLDETQLAELRTLLEAAELKNLKTRETAAKLAFGEGDFTLLAVPREDTVQRLSFAHYFQVVGNRDKPGGYSGTQYVVSPEEHVLNPIREWLKNNMEKQKLAPLRDSAPTNCNADR